MTDLISSIFPIETPVPTVQKLPLGVLSLFDRVPNRVKKMRWNGEVFQKLEYSPDNVETFDTRRACGDEMATSGDGARWVDITPQNNIVRVNVFKYTEARMKAMNAAEASPNGIAAAFKKENVMMLNFQDKLNIGRQLARDKVFAQLKANLGTNPVNLSVTPPTVTITSTVSGQASVPNPAWNVNIIDGMLANGLMDESFAKVAGSPAAALKTLVPVAINGSSNLNMRATPGLTYYDPVVDTSDLYTDDYNNIIYVQDGAFALDFLSDVSPSVPVISSINDFIVTDLRSKMVEVFGTGMPSNDTLKMLWFDAEVGLWWDVYFEKVNCKGIVTYEMWMQTNPQLVHTPSNYIRIGGYTGAFIVGACKYIAPTCTPVETDFAVIQNCITNLVFDTCVSTFPAGLTVLLDGPDVATSSVIPIAINNTAGGVVQVLRGIQNNRRFIVARAYGSNENFGATINLPTGSYELNFGACGTVTFDVVECAPTTVAEPLAVLNAQRTASNQSAEETQIFTIATGDPLIGSTALIVNSHFTDVIVQKKSTGVDSKILINPDDYTFDATTHTITLIVAIAAGDVFEIIGA